MASRLWILATALATAGGLGAVLSAGTPRIVRRLVVPIGERVETNVDYKLGYACDDPTILRVWMYTRDGHNWFVVEGVTVGRTWCRVGTDPAFPSYLFDVSVVQPKPMPRPSAHHLLAPRT